MISVPILYSAQKIIKSCVVVLCNSPKGRNFADKMPNFVQMRVQS